MNRSQVNNKLNINITTTILVIILRALVTLPIVAGSRHIAVRSTGHHIENNTIDGLILIVFQNRRHNQRRKIHAMPVISHNLHLASL